MKTWAIVHAGSGAVLAITSRPPEETAEGFEVVASPENAEASAIWWDGEAFQPREVAGVSVPVEYAEPGDVVTVDCPAGAWMSLPGGVISSDPEFTVPPNLKGCYVSLVGRYRGEAFFNIVKPSTALQQLREERNLRLQASDKFVLPDFPNSAEDKQAWAEYRAALRDVPEEQPTANLATVVWPTAPGEV